MRIFQKKTSHSRQLIICCFFYAFFLGSSVYGAESSKEIVDLWQNLQNFKTFSGSFSQSVVNVKMPQFRPKRTQGQAWLQKPNLFRWQLKEPDNQLIVSDGHYVWLYDKDLKQVTQRPYQVQQRDIANLLLSGNVEELKSNYTVKLISDEASQKNQEFLLQPMQKDAMLREIVLSFKQGKLFQLIMIDGMGKKTTFKFSAVKINQPIKKQLFTFTVPKGVDLIKEQAQTSS